MPDDFAAVSRRKQLELCESRMGRGVTLITALGGYLAGLNTMEECMRDDNLRPFLGHALLHEIMPNVALDKEISEEYAAKLCAGLENPEKPLSLLSVIGDSVSVWRQDVLPTLKTYEAREFSVPPCLTFGLSALILFHAGAKPDAEGQYFASREEERYPVSGDEYALRAFSRLSRDMAPESLAYAVLADQELWGEDLRRVDGLEDKVTEQLRDLQLLGLRATMEKAWRDHED